MCGRWNGRKAEEDIRNIRSHRKLECWFLVGVIQAKFRKALNYWTFSLYPRQDDPDPRAFHELSPRMRF